MILFGLALISIVLVFPRCLRAFINLKVYIVASGPHRQAVVATVEGKTWVKEWNKILKAA